MRVKKIVDLSWPLTENTPIYPGDPEPRITPVLSIAEHGYNISKLELGTQTGSHLDAPYHFYSGGKTMGDLDLTMFFGEAVVVRVTDKKAREEITPLDLKPWLSRIKKDTIVLFNTNWYKHVGAGAFFDHPYISLVTAELLVGLGVRFICIDTINADPTGGTSFPVHDLFAEKNLVIGENMAYFDRIDFEDPFVAAFPLNLTGCDGSPVRAAAIQFERPI